MLVGVLHGPNFNVLERRDAAVYGGSRRPSSRGGSADGGAELGCDVLCRQTNHEGEYIEWCQELGESAGGLVVNSGAWSHYSYAIRDALELARCPVVEVHSRHREQGGLAAAHRHCRHRGAPGDRQRPRRLQGGTGIPDTRIDRLRALFEEPLLVTAPTNVLYLTGFELDAAVLVEQDRVRLFTDFRYLERAPRGRGVDVEQTERHIYSDLAGRIPDTIGSRPTP